MNQNHEVIPNMKSAEPREFLTPEGTRACHLALGPSRVQTEVFVDIGRRCEISVAPGIRFLPEASIMLVGNRGGLVSQAFC